MAHTHKGKTSKGEDQTMPEPEGYCTICSKKLFDTYTHHYHGLVCNDPDCMAEIIQNLSHEVGNLHE